MWGHIPAYDHLWCYFCHVGDYEWFQGKRTICPLVYFYVAGFAALVWLWA